MTALPRHEWGNRAQWAISAPLLAAHLAGVAWALPAVLALCAASVVWYRVRLGGFRPYRLQVRLGFMAVSALAALPGLAAVAWIPLLGTSAQVLLGICPMARALGLMPWNRSGPLPLAAARAALLAPPGAEGLLVPTGSARRGLAAPPGRGA